MLLRIQKYIVKDLTGKRKHQKKDKMTIYSVLKCEAKKKKTGVCSQKMQINIG